MVHSLSAEDRATVKRIAQERHNTARESGTVNLKIGKQSDEFVDLNGLGGEVAFCRLFGLEPDFDTSNGAENKVDARLPDGRTVDIKTTDHPRGNLLARVIHDEIDVFVLVRGRFPSYKLVGWIDRAIFKRSRKKNMGYGPTHFYSAENLHPIETLLD